MTTEKYTRLMKEMLVSFHNEDDPMKAMLEWMSQQLMEIEVNNLKTMADKGKHDPDRKNYRNGYRTRRWDTRMGSIYLMIPRVRKGGYQPFFITHKQRSEAGLISVVQEAFVNGISTRKMRRVLDAMGVDGISAGQVSNLTKSLEEEVSTFRYRQLNGHYPLVWIDAMYEKIRVDGKVQSVAIMIAMAVDDSGRKQLLAIEPMHNESEDTWGLFFDRLSERGLTHIGTLVSDAHKGIQAALKGRFTGTSWQRCKVHFMRNILAKVPHKFKARVGADLSILFKQELIEDARSFSELLFEKYTSICPEAMDLLSDGLEDALQFMAHPELPRERVSSTNYLERLNKEIRRRSRVVTVFPSIDSFLRLMGSYLIEYHEDWANDRAYIQEPKLHTLVHSFHEKEVA